MNNTIENIKAMMGGKNPQQVAMQMLGNNSNPMILNLVKMAQSGNSEGIETFARNIYKERGMDFDKEFAEFMKNFKQLSTQ